jgi:hypothetical protein
MANKSDVVKPVAKIRLVCDGSSTVTIHRLGLPYIVDKELEAVQWIKANVAKPEEVEIVGERPASWDIVFPVQKPEDAMAEPVTPEVIQEPTDTIAEVVNS